MLEEEGFQRNICQKNITYLAEQFIHYPLIDNLLLNSVDCSLLQLLQTETGMINCDGIGVTKYSMQRLVSIYLIHQILFSKDTTILLIAQTKHIARKELETLYFPMNHLGLSFLPEIEVKYTGCLKLSNNVCIRSFGINDEIPAWETKKVVVISYNLSGIPTQLHGRKWIQVAGALGI